MPDTATMTAKPPVFQIPAAEAALPVPSQPEAPLTGYIGTQAATGEARKQLICHQLLSPESLEKAAGEAAALLPQMLGNTELFLSYGSKEVAELNQLIDRMLKDVGRTDSAEIKALMKRLNDRMRETKSDYDPSDPAVREKFEKWSKGVRGFLHRGKTMLEMLIEDIRSIEGQLDKIVDTVNDKERQMIRNILLYDELYRQNEAEIQNVMYVIAVMELIAELAGQQAEAIVVDPDDPQQHEAAERKRVLSEFASNMSIRIAEFKNRLFIGWATSPQVSTMRTLDVGLATKLRTLTIIVIPSMKGQLVQWRMMLQSLEGAEIEQAIAASANEWVGGYAKALTASVPLIMQAIQDPTLTVETINGVADEIGAQAQLVIKGFEEGERKRTAVDNAIAESAVEIRKASRELTDAIVDHIVAQASTKADVDSTAVEVTQEALTEGH